ncbi:MAG TPA: transcriptional regulator, partial [Verrucomicrobiae bacterium]
MTVKKKVIKKVAPRGHSKSVATSAAILGRPVAKANAGPDLKKVKPEWQKFCLHLLELREQLTKQMSGLAEESA